MTEYVNVNSPCVNICTINPETGFCFGCYRTVREISDWAALSDTDKLRLLTDLDARRAEDQ